MLPVIQIGPLAIQSFGLILLISYYFATVVIDRAAKVRQLDAGKIEKTILFATIAGIVGARLGFVLLNPSAFSGNWWNAFSINPALLDTTSGLVIGLITAIASVSKYKLPAWDVLDVFTPGGVVFIFGLYLAFFASGKNLGVNTNLPWGLMVGGAVRHPVQLYELAGMLIIGLWIWWQFTKAPEQIIPGKVFLYFVAASAGLRLFLDIFHQPGTMLFGFREIQLICLVLMIISFGILASKKIDLTALSENASGDEDLETGK